MKTRGPWVFCQIRIFLLWIVPIASPVEATASKSTFVPPYSFYLWTGHRKSTYWYLGSYGSTAEFSSFLLVLINICSSYRSLKLASQVRSLSDWILIPEHASESRIRIQVRKKKFLKPRKFSFAMTFLQKKFFYSRESGEHLHNWAKPYFLERGTRSMITKIPAPNPISSKLKCDRTRICEMQHYCKHGCWCDTCQPFDVRDFLLAGQLDGELLIVIFIFKRGQAFILQDLF